MLVWREGEQVLLGHNDPRELSSAYEVAAHAQTVEHLTSLLAALAAEAAASAETTS
jgi:hypothetical protein